ncbi:threonine-phosphate decarboxylase CobD [Fuchsiella alkaliacetigena]|uniref:threonine-phosphate decarboxylase CobD n=1 Tax=Fuchsiella alkaliacetigena TaxID=957042 RepID=UPI00200A235B|nr:threonine-phosphate decarboxylase CobD [Fuchsiella alkaliacetigena]MCK8825513.1 threonine-phosphate decarboxylase CobD [Fuchsiella alkaliacetigena]
MASQNKTHGGNIKAAVEEYGLAKEQVIDFSANINFLGPPAVTEEIIKDNLQEIINYPQPDAKELATQLAVTSKVKPEQVIVGNGAVEIIYLITKVLAPQLALVLAPTFSEYEAALESVDSQIELFKLQRSQGFSLEVQKLLDRLESRAYELLFLCNPNNPTGELVTKEELLQVLAVAEEQNTFVVVDEAFLDFIEAEEEYSLISETEARENLLVLRSLTKFFAIPGLRVGYAVSNSSLIEKLEFSKDPWNVNLFAQEVAKQVIKEEEYINKTKQAVQREKEFLYSALKDFASLQPYPPTVNYILIDISATDYTSTELKDELAQQGILIRDCSTYHLLGSDFVRVAVKSREDNRRLLEELELLL